MVKISLSGSGEGPGWVTAPGYSTAPILTSDNEEGRMGGAAEWDAGGEHGSRPAAGPIRSR